MEQLHINFLLVFAFALIPLMIGMIWYSKALFGNAWMAASGLTEEKAKSGNMALTIGIAYLFSLMLSFIMYPVVIHQMSFSSMLQAQLMADATKESATAFLNDGLAKYGHEFRTFKHGMLHGTIAAVFMALPLIGTCAIFERRSFKYIMIHLGYWIISLMLLGGAICQFA
jgi:hypothetical protein